MFGYFSSKKDKPKTSSGTKRRANRVGLSDAAKKRIADRAAAKAARDKKAKDAGTQNKKRIAAKEAARKEKLAAQKKARADKKATPKPKATAKKQSQYANLDKGTKDAAGLTKGQKASTKKAVAASKSTGTVKTKGGEYKTFAKGSKAAGSFREAFALAKKKGGKTFTWNGKKYNTKTK